MATQHDDLLAALKSAAANASSNQRIDAMVKAAQNKGYIVHTVTDAQIFVSGSVPIGGAGVEISMPVYGLR